MGAAIEAVLETHCCNNSSNIKHFCLPVSAFHTVISISLFRKLSWLFSLKSLPEAPCCSPICQFVLRGDIILGKFSTFFYFSLSGTELPHFCHAQEGSLSCQDHSSAASHPNCIPGSWAEVNQSLHRGPLSPLSTQHHRIALPRGYGRNASMLVLS